MTGAVGIRVGGRQLSGEGLNWRVTRRALTMLALERGVVTRDRLGDVVWDGAPPPTWETALRGSISHIRRAVTAAGGLDPILTSAGGYALAPVVRVDALEASASVATAEGALSSQDASTAAGAASDAAKVLAVVIAPSEEGEWFDVQRRAFGALARRALMVESSAATALGDHQQAIAAAESLIAVDPFVETAHQRLMAAHAAAGNRSEAIVAYLRCRDLLAAELGVDPSQSTVAAYQDLLDGPSDAGLHSLVAPPGMPTALAGRPEVFGRDAELSELERLLSGRHPEGGLVLVSGPAGIGKTTLAASAAAAAHAAGATVLHGSFEADSLAPLVAYAGPLGQVGVAWPPPNLSVAAGAEHVRTLAATAAAPLRRLRQRHRLLLVLDDLHWADRASLGVLGVLLDEVPGLVVLATSRIDVVNAALEDLCRQRAGDVSFHQVGPLDRRGTERLVSEWSGEPVPPDLAVLVHERSGGNPLLATRLLQAIGDRPRDEARRLLTGAPPDGGWPGSADLLVGWWDRIDQEAQRAAVLAALLGDTVHADLVAAISGHSVPAVLARFEQSVQCGLLGQVEGDPSRFRFTHSLLRDAVRGTLDPAALAELHRCIAEVLADRTDADPAELVRHSIASGDPTLLERAAAPAATTALHLATLGDPEAAAAMLQQMAHHLATTCPGAAAARARIAVARVVAELTLNNVSVARSHLASALQLAIDAAEPGVLEPLLDVARNPEEPDDDGPIVALLEALLATTDAASRQRAIILVLLGYELGRGPSTARALALTAEAAEISRARVDPSLLQVALHAWHDTSRPSTHPSHRRQVMEEAIALEPILPRRHLSGASWFRLATDLLELGDGVGARHALDQMQQRMHGGSPVMMAWMHVRMETALATAEGRWLDAEAHLAVSEQIAARLGSIETLLITFAQRVTLNQFRGDSEPFRDLLETSAASTEAPPILVCGSAFADAELGHPNAAASTDRAVEVALSMPPLLTTLPSLVLASIAAAATHHRRCADLAAALRPRSGCHATIAGAAYLGPVDWILGLLAMSSDDLDGAIELLTGAEDQCRAFPSEPFLARVQADRARVHLRRAAKGDALTARRLRAEVAAAAAHHQLDPVRIHLTDPPEP